VTSIQPKHAGLSGISVYREAAGMQLFREKPVLAFGLLIVAVIALVASWFLTTRTPEPQMPTYTPPPQQSNPETGQGQPL
jgi:hypothetical protein